MKAIWKFPLEQLGEQTIQMPAGAKILSAQMQDRTLCLWALCNPDAPKADRRFEIIGTGHPFDLALLHYVATVQDGSMVWHLFEDQTQ